MENYNYSNQGFNSNNNYYRNNNEDNVNEVPDDNQNTNLNNYKGSNYYQSQDNTQNADLKITNKDRKVLSRLKREVDKTQLENNIQNTLKLNKMDLIDPYDNTMKNSLFFRLNVSGRIESAKFYEGDAIYCKYDIVFGPDWEKEDGQLSGQSQYACKGEGSYDYFVWNLPFESSFRSLNPYGWPQIVLTCCSPDFLGREVVKGYGVINVPTQPGRHERTVQIFSPLTSSVFLNFLGILVGQKAEIINAPKVISSGEGREITRTRSEGFVKIVFQITTRDMEKFGYNV